MSFGFELDTRGQRELQGYMQQNVATPEQIDENADPGMFAGTGGLFMSELAAAGRSVAIAGGAIPVVLDKVMGADNLSSRSMADRYFEAVDDVTKSAVEYWKPSPAATGAAGRVLGPVAGGIVQLAATGGHPALMMLRQQVGTAAELVDQGVDSTTAQMVGGAQGLATAVGFRLGTVGTSLGAKMASGAAGNLATNVPAAAASQAVLEQGGYTEQAKQFNPFDLEARAIDVLMGAAFGAVAHYGPKPADTTAPGDTPPPQTRLLPEERAALLTANAARNWDESAPGRPASDVDLAMHNNAMNTALEQMMRNEPVDVAAHIEGASFMPRADVPEATVVPTLRSLLGEYSEADAIVNEASKLFGKDTFKDNVDFATPDDIQVAYDALLPIAGEKLKRGEVKQLTAELADLQQKRQAIVDTPASSYKDTAKDALKGTRKKVKEALKLAEDIRAQDLAPIDERIKAIEDRLSKHDTSAQAEAMLSRIEQYKRTPAYIRAVEAARQLAPVADTARADAPATRAEPDTTTPTQADGKTGSPVGKTAAAEEPEIAAARAAIERQPAGAVIDLGDEANPMIVDVREAWKQIEQEMQQAKKEAEGFMAAVTCYLGG
jgi:hypothetical protein